jgi:hypothetical protein
VRGETRLEQEHDIASRFDELAGEPHDTLRPRRDGHRRRETAGDPAQRRVALRDGSAVLGRKRGARGRKPPDDSIEIRSPSRGWALDHHQAIGSEDKRRHLGAQLLGGPQPCTVQQRTFALAEPERDLELDRRPRSIAADDDATRAFSKADKIRVAARALREPLRADVERLEQVRLASTVRADDQNEPGPELYVEPYIRAKVAERELTSDQPLRHRLRCRCQDVRAVPVRPSELTGRADCKHDCG